MAIDTRPPRPTGRDAERPPVRRTPVRDPDDGGRPSRSLVVALVLACAALMVLDTTGGDDSPVAEIRKVVGEAVGPLQTAAATGVRPVADLPDAFRSNDSLRQDVRDLQAENAALRNQLDKAGYDAHRVEQLDGLRALARDSGYALRVARVIAIGSAQSFASTITIDAGSEAGLHPDMTVVAAQGLVGRVTSVTSRTATVLLIVDSTSKVGGRIGANSELGFVSGHGTLGDDDRLELELTDRNVVPKVGQTIVTWGSEGGAPYVAGVPIGKVAKVFESLRETTYRAEIEANVDFTALDYVAVVVPSGTPGPVIEADGSLR